MSALPRLCCLLLTALPGMPLRADETSDLCINAAQNAAQDIGVPVEVLIALTLTETGRGGPEGMMPWPWAVNLSGESHFPASATDAAELVQHGLDAGLTNIDLGCFQLNWRWHGAHFPSVEAMLDPQSNATYAAEFIAGLYAKTGSWRDAAADYHSQTPEKASVYLARFEPILAALMETDRPEADPPPRESRYALLQAGVAGSPGSLVPLSGAARPLFGGP